MSKANALGMVDVDLNGKTEPENLVEDSLPEPPKPSLDERIANARAQAESCIAQANYWRGVADSFQAMKDGQI